MVANNREPLPIQDLAVFAAVAEARGFSSAARRLGVSKAMVSVAVARLEARLGVRLFQRTTRKLSLTEAGASALPHAERAWSAARDAEEAATRAATEPRGTLRINAPMTFGLLQVAPALGAFALSYPEVTVDLELDDRVLDLVEGGFDMAVRIASLADSSLVAQRIGKNRNVIVAHRDYLARAGRPARPADLTRHAALVYSLSPTGARWTFTRGKKKEVVDVTGPVRANSTLALREALLQGLGLGRAPLFAVAEDIAGGRLEQVLPAWRLPEQGIYAVTTSREHVPRKTRAFIAFLRDRIGDPPVWERLVSEL